MHTKGGLNTDGIRVLNNVTISPEKVLALPPTFSGLRCSLSIAARLMRLLPAPISRRSFSWLSPAPLRMRIHSDGADECCCCCFSDAEGEVTFVVTSITSLLCAVLQRVVRGVEENRTQHDAVHAHWALCGRTIGVGGHPCAVRQVELRIERGGTRAHTS